MPENGQDFSSQDTGQPMGNPESTQQTEQHGYQEQSDNQGYQQQPEHHNPSNAAFAQMRIQMKQLEEQNRQFQNTLSSYGQRVGIQGDYNDVMAALQEEAQYTQAEQMNVPVELLQEIEQLKQVTNQYQQEALSNRADQAFLGLQRQYNLSNEDLLQFAQSLDDAGMSPYMNPNVDLQKEYVYRNMDRIVQAQVNAALQRDQYGQAQGSYANSRNGGVGNQTTVSTTEGLNSLLDSIMK